MNLFRRTFVNATGVAAVIAQAALLAGCAAPAKPAAVPAIPEVAIEFNGKEFKVPANMPGGIVAVVITNTSDKPKAIGISRLRPGKTYDEVYKLMKDAPDDFVNIFKLVSSVLAVDPIAPGKPKRVVADLKTGSFILDATDHFEEAPPPDAPRVYGEFKADTVAGIVEPKADIATELTDFAFVMPDQIKAGKQLWKVSNNGKQWHMFFLAKPNDGISPDDVLKVLSTDGPPSGPPPFEVISGSDPISEGERQWIEIDLKPGTYVVVCPLPDFSTAGGPPISHLAHGMHKTLVVK